MLLILAFAVFGFRAPMPWQPSLEQVQAWRWAWKRETRRGLRLRGLVASRVMRAKTRKVHLNKSEQAKALDVLRQGERLASKLMVKADWTQPIWHHFKDWRDSAQEVIRGKAVETAMLKHPKGETR